MVSLLLLERGLGEASLAVRVRPDAGVARISRFIDLLEASCRDCGLGLYWELEWRQGANPASVSSLRKEINPHTSLPACAGFSYRKSDAKWKKPHSSSPVDDEAFAEAEVAHPLRYAWQCASAFVIKPFACIFATAGYQKSRASEV